MAALINYGPDQSYRSVENYGFSVINETVQPQPQFESVNIYSMNSSDMQNNEKISTIRDFFLRCCSCCCSSTSNDNNDSPFDGSNSALVGHVGRSYTLNTEAINPVVHRAVPTVTITKVIDNDSIKSTQLLLNSEKDASTSFAKIKMKKEKGSQSESLYDSGHNSRSSTLKTGEKTSFIREILNCRDSFIRSLELCDNSLTRGKKYRFIKRDDWVDEENNGIQKSVTILRKHV